MEQRALVILFNGNDISDEQIGKSVESSPSTQSHIQKM